MVSKTVLWLSVLFSLQSFAPTSEGSTLLEVYSNDDGNNESLAASKCEEIEGDLTDCSECYDCEKEVLEKHRKKGHIVKLKIKNHNCTIVTEVCCVPQKNLQFRNTDRECGNRNPDGYPRRLRDGPRSVLPGEYPWRVWIYRIHDPSESLCAGTYLGTNKRMVMTSASCVEKYSHGDLVVRFDKNLTRRPEAIEVLKMKIHDCFNKDTHDNNIALLNLASVPSWSQSVCLPEHPALHGTSCIAVSNNDIYIDQVLPQQSNCGQDGGPMDQSLMCVAGRKETNKPEPGSGLFCTEVRSGEELLYVYGIHLHQTDDGRLSVGTNVTHYRDWIAKNINSQTDFETPC